MKKFKKLLVVILFLTQYKITQAQYLPYYDRKESWNGLQMMNLKGKVKSLKQTTYLAIDSAGVAKKGTKRSEPDQISVRSDSYVEFDDKGRMYREAYYNLLGGGGDTLGHTYNDVKKTEEITGQGSDGIIYMRYLYKYDKKGKIIEDSISQWVGNKKYFYQVLTYKYDEKGDETERTYYSSDSKLNNYKTIFKYQKKENQTIKEGYDEKGAIRFKTSFKTDSQGNKIEEYYYTADCKVLEHILRFKYDDYGNVIQKEYYKPENSSTIIWAYKYEYDKSNNWIKRTDFEKGKATYILERNLEYY